MSIERRKSETTKRRMKKMIWKTHRIFQTVNESVDGEK